MRYFLFAIAVSLATTPAYAGKTTVTASNGVVIDVSGDDFSGRYEYSAPAIEISEDGLSGDFFVAAIKQKGVVKNVDQGFVLYTGDWRNYSSAVYKGGDPVKYEVGERNVDDCSYGSCSLTEGFFVTIPDAEIAKHAVGSVLPIQIRSTSTNTFIVNIPISYIKAVEEVAHKG